MKLDRPDPSINCKYLDSSTSGAHHVTSRSSLAGDQNNVYVAENFIGTVAGFTESRVRYEALRIRKKRPQLVDVDVQELPRTFERSSHS